MTNPTITPLLWYDNNAQDAANFYAAIFPDALLGSSDRAASKRAMHAMLTMNKLDIAELQRAFDGN